MIIINNNNNVICDVTVACTYVEASASEVGAAAETAATRKMANCTYLSTKSVFHPIPAETQGPLSESACDPMSDFGTGTAMSSGAFFLYFSVVVQRFYSVLLHESFVLRISRTDDHSRLIVFFNFYPRDAMLARVFAIATCLSVCPSVCPSHAGIVTSRAKAGS